MKTKPHTLIVLPGKGGGGPPGPAGPGNLSPPGMAPGKRPRPLLLGGNAARELPPGGPALPSPDIWPDCVAVMKKQKCNYVSQNRLKLSNSQPEVLCSTEVKVKLYEHHLVPPHLRK